MEDDHKEAQPAPVPVEEAHVHSTSTSTWFMGGIIIGSVASAILVSYLTKQAQLNKFKRNKNKKGPSSGSPVTYVDTEKEV